jgi:hypothetical protein
LRCFRRLGPGRVGQHHAEVLEDALALVQGLQVGDITVPLLALEHDSTRLEAAEHRADLLLIIALDLGQRIEVFRDPLVQLDRRQRRILRHVTEQRLQQLAKGKAVGIVQAFAGLHIIEQAADGIEAARIVRGRQGRQRIVGFGDAFLVFVEQLLADPIRLGALCFGHAILVEGQHDHLAVGIEHALHVGGDGTRLQRLAWRLRLG